MTDAIDESETGITEPPRQIARRWLASLPDSELRQVSRSLDEESSAYQSYSDARITGDRWQQAFDEMEGRGLIKTKKEVKQ